MTNPRDGAGAGSTEGRGPRGEGVEMPRCAPRAILRGQSAIVTGASSGIGRAIAIEMARSGANVVVNYVGDDDAAEEVVKRIDGLGSEQAGRSIAHKADVSDEGQVEGLFDAAREAFETIEILVNNAGIQQDAAIDEMTIDQWRSVIDVNLTGQFLCARAAIREFKRHGVRSDVSCAAGKIICMSSVHDAIPWAGRVNYAASKGGVDLMMKSIAQEVAPHRIRVNCVSPGAIATPINEEAWKDPKSRRRLLELIPYDRVGEPEDVARLAVWLASDESDYVVGATIYIDGGMMLYPGFAEGG